MARKRRRYVPAVGPRLRKLLYVVFGLFALLAVNAVYLTSISILEWSTGATYQNYFYQYMFLGHLVLGLVLIVPLIAYGAIHIKNAHGRPNRRAVKVGYALFIVAIILVISGLVLTRGIPWIEVRDPQAREASYWIHVITPLVAAWLFILHRLAGVPIKWRIGGAVAAGAVLLSAIAMYFQAQDPRQWNVAGPVEGEKYFFPSLARTATGNFIPAETMMRDDYCVECHEDTHRQWSYSVHRFASFNNPAYLFSVRNTREFALQRDGNVRAARFCAACHDPVPFFSGAFDDPQFDDVNHPTSQAGITCTACHAITHVNSQRGNGDYTIEEPLHYPFMDSDNPLLQWTNRFLVKSKPEFHKRSFLKPLHRSAEFCAGCHKVHLPEELNGYKWLRGQNHYDAWLLSGVSGVGVSSFYYPDKPQRNCNGCHMPLQASQDFGARYLDESDELKIHDHQFPSANTAIPYLLGMPQEVIDAHRDFLEDSLRVDIFGLRRGGTIDGELLAPIRPQLPALIPGETYLLEVVVRTLTLGHLFTQGTADSNEIWLAVDVKGDTGPVANSGQYVSNDGQVDPRAHFVNAYVIDRDGNRIDQRNAEDIFTTLYNNQIPPGAADVVHYRFTVPEDASGQLQLEVGLKYRKFDTTYMRHFQGESFVRNDLPVVNIATDTVVLPVAEAGGAESETAIPQWLRWNDYGIGLLRKRGAGQLRQAEDAFREVERLGRADGALNLARVYLREGRLDDAVAALRRASTAKSPAYPWTVLWFTSLVNKQNGFLDEAIEGFKALVETQFTEAQARGFDFSRDYRLLNQLAETLFERARLERGGARESKRTELLAEAQRWYEAALAVDPENTTAHYGLSQVHAASGRSEAAAKHRELHAKYKPDDNARDRAIALARSRDPNADHAADAVVIYDLAPAAGKQGASR
ncbi:MAG: hypothetical protein HKN06_08425 [Gammaproteobacteria bacterium]|nr:hypothetical protein [Gammaproteobacteria bacterium]